MTTNNTVSLIEYDLQSLKAEIKRGLSDIAAGEKKEARGTQEIAYGFIAAACNGYSFPMGVKEDGEKPTYFLNMTHLRDMADEYKTKQLRDSMVAEARVSIRSQFLPPIEKVDAADRGSAKEESIRKSNADVRVQYNAIDLGLRLACAIAKSASVHGVTDAAVLKAWNDKAGAFTLPRKMFGPRGVENRDLYVARAGKRLDKRLTSAVLGERGRVSYPDTKSGTFSWTHYETTIKGFLAVWTKVPAAKASKSEDKPKIDATIKSAVEFLTSVVKSANKSESPTIVKGKTDIEALDALCSLLNEWHETRPTFEEITERMANKAANVAPKAA